MDEEGASGPAVGSVLLTVRAEAATCSSRRAKAGQSRPHGAGLASRQFRACGANHTARVSWLAHARQSPPFHSSGRTLRAAAQRVRRGCIHPRSAITFALDVENRLLLHVLPDPKRKCRRPRPVRRSSGSLRSALWQVLRAGAQADVRRVICVLHRQRPEPAVAHAAEMAGLPCGEQGVSSPGQGRALLCSSGACVDIRSSPSRQWRPPGPGASAVVPPPMLVRVMLRSVGAAWPCRKRAFRTRADRRRSRRCMPSARRSGGR